MLDIQEKEPVPIFRIRNSSRVGSHTKSSHIWQKRPPVLDSTSKQVSYTLHCLKKNHTKSVQGLRPMCNAVLCGRSGGALQAEIIRREGSEGLILGCLGGLWHDRGVVKDHPQAVLVVGDSAPHAVHRPGAQEQLEMLYVHPVC